MRRMRLVYHRRLHKQKSEHTTAHDDFNIDKHLITDAQEIENDKHRSLRNYH